jgi:type II secretory pathway component HofQ
MHRVIFGLSAALLLFCDAALPAAPRLSLEAQQADVAATLRQLAQLGGLNLVIGPDVKGTISLRLKEVSVDEALAAIARAAGLVYWREGSVLTVLSQSAWLAQQRQLAEAYSLGRGPFRTVVIPLHYASAAELAPLVAALLSPWGTIAVDARTNSLIIRDIADSPALQPPPAPR